jgi:hypothetical protein
MSGSETGQWFERLAAYLRQVHSTAGAFAAARIVALDLPARAALRQELVNVERVRASGGFTDQATYDAAVLNRVALAVRKVRSVRSPAVRDHLCKPSMVPLLGPYDPPRNLLKMERYSNTMADFLS